MHNIFFTIYLTINFATYLMFMLDKMAAIYINEPESKALSRFGLYKISRSLFIPTSRTAESTLLLFALIGGAPGALISMYRYRHKTRKAKFYILIPLFLIIQLYAAYCLYPYITSAE